MKTIDILLASNIKRWAIVSTIREQSVAEHSFNVAMIARAISKEAGYFNDANIIKYALDHDLDEVFTGDIPTPAKVRLGIEDDYQGKSKTYCNSAELVIVKLADMIDALHFIVDNKIGRHGDIVATDLAARYDRKCKELWNDYSHIVGAAGVVVEELTSGEYEVEKKHV